MQLFPLTLVTQIPEYSRLFLTQVRPSHAHARVMMIHCDSPWTRRNEARRFRAMTNALIESTSVSVGKADRWIRMYNMVEESKTEGNGGSRKRGRGEGRGEAWGMLPWCCWGEQREGPSWVPDGHLPCSFLPSLVGLCCHNVCFPGWYILKTEILLEENTHRILYVYSHTEVSTWSPRVRFRQWPYQVPPTSYLAPLAIRVLTPQSRWESQLKCWMLRVWHTVSA